VIVTCAECASQLDVTDARGPDGFGDYLCLDVEACDARWLDLLANELEDDDGI
jgi:hypothetical protein